MYAMHRVKTHFFALKPFATTCSRRFVRRTENSKKRWSILEWLSLKIPTKLRKSTRALTDNMIYWKQSSQLRLTLKTTWSLYRTVIAENADSISSTQNIRMSFKTQDWTLNQRDIRHELNQEWNVVNYFVISEELEIVHWVSLKNK